MKGSGLVVRHTLLRDLLMMWCTILSLIDLIVLFLIFVKDVEFPRWSIMLYLFIYLPVVASALYSFLGLCCRNFLFCFFFVQLCSILGLRDSRGVTSRGFAHFIEHLGCKG